MDEYLFLTKIQYFSTGLILGISMLHLILFIYWRKRRTNLFYALFLLLLGVTIFSDFQQMVTSDQYSLLFLRIQRGSLSISLIAGLLFFYRLFRNRVPLHFWLITSLLIFTGIAAVIQPSSNFIYLELVVIAVLIEIIRITYLALQSGLNRLWIIGVGFAIFSLFGSYDLLLDLELLSPLFGLTNGYQFGVIGLIITTSIYLAYDISVTNKKVIEQEKNIFQQKLKREMLQNEVDRTSKELEEARKLQLSMLPHRLPETDTLLMAASMRTAVEVGGDYYDYYKSEDDQLTLVIGDATGHGNKAGFMVAIIKSLFKSFQPESDFPEFFNKVTLILKQMNLGTLFMALTCMEVKNNVLTASAAGMPPILVFRNESKSIEEYVIKGMPLGAVNNFDYKQITVELNPNDTVLLVSDGLHELFNKNRDMFGWKRVKSAFEEYAHLKPNEIIDNLKYEADRWRGDKPIDDDITFVVMKFK
ncbi:PP2C family protein-serine/threonine phosphatase [Fodinibius sp. SL11]|uniref:PP2C family protein-serine/threonine phosphatase n=1 Tax=Fodinibius sp. SL11 TaxID=3425690 RepID=UPI003F882BEC